MYLQDVWRGVVFCGGLKKMRHGQVVVRWSVKFLTDSQSTKETVSVSGLSGVGTKLRPDLIDLGISD